MEIWGTDDLDFARGLGFAHACDRGLQMMYTRLVGQGRLSECLMSSEQTLAIDVFMREMGFAGEAVSEAKQMKPDTRRFVDAYCDGVNLYVRRHGASLELQIAGYRPEPWEPQDSLALGQLISYIGLAQTQQDAEKFIIEALAAGVPLEMMRVLFSPWLDGLDSRLVSLMKHVRVGQPILPPEVRLDTALPSLMSSNNWAVLGTRTASGTPFQCNDPHQECNRLPAIWYEVVAHTKDDFRIGITMPGLPGLLMGRTRALSFGFTYGFMDMVDYFLEDVRGGRFRRGDSFEAFDVTKEWIHRQRGKSIEISVRENRHGVLESNSLNPALEDGLYLCRAYSNHRGGAADSMDSLRRLLLARTVGEAADALHGFTASFNFVFADRGGNIAYRQTGRLPRRKHSGLYPLEGWDAGNDWEGFVNDVELTSFRNPAEGFIATANDDMDRPGHPKAINLSMGSYRAERIRSLLSASEHLTLPDMKRIQTDLYSLQAELFMKRLGPFLPDTSAARLLAEWDLRYDRLSLGASIFEQVYRALLERVFGENMFGRDLWRMLLDTTCLFDIYYHLFDRILLGEDDPRFFGPGGQAALYRDLLQRTLGTIDPATVRPWGEIRQFKMEHIFFRGKLPRLIGLDYGPIQSEGGRATIVQHAAFRSHGRPVVVRPSYRYMTDLATDIVHSALAGGPSDRRFSPYYTSDVERWLHGEYKELKPRARQTPGHEPDSATDGH